MTVRPSPAARPIVDLSVPLRPGMPVYPGDPEVAFAPVLTVAEHGAAVLGLHLGSQTGTHVDAPRHLLPGGAAVDEVPLERFVAPLVLAPLAVETDQPISLADLSPVLDLLGPGTALVLHTGWSDRYWGDERYWVHPYLAAEAAEAVVERGVRTVGIDAPSLDRTPPAGAPLDLGAHRAILGAGGVIVENLTNLDAVGTTGWTLSVLPLRLVGADGAPVRAVATGPLPDCSDQPAGTP